MDPSVEGTVRRGVAALTWVEEWLETGDVYPVSR